MTAPDRLDLFAPITKRERDPETGHLYVYGKMTGADLDHDQQRMDPNWLKTAVPDWFRVGNVREMHQPKAAGKGVELIEKDDGWYLRSKIVDKDTIEKIDNDVLIGYSIGISSPRLDRTKADAPNGWVTGGRIVETSVVDSPCLPTAVFTLAKADSAGELQLVDEPHLVKIDRLAEPPTGGLPAIVSKADLRKAIRAAGDDPGDDLLGHILTRADALQLADMIPATWPLEVPDVEKAKYSAADRRDMAKASEAMRDGSYPIRDAEDLDNAIHAVGRGGGSHEAIRAHIVKRAKALGMSDRIPDNWNSSGAMSEKAAQIAEQVRALVPALAKADGDTPSADEAGDDYEAADIADATSAIGAIAKLIISEAESLAAGNLGEAGDIACLLEAISALKWFICLEQSESKEESLMLTDTTDQAPVQEPDATKTDTPAVEPPTQPVEKTDSADTSTETSTDPADAGDVVTKAQVADMVKAAIAEASTATEERIEALETAKADLEAKNKALEADVVKALELPELGGPVLTRTAVQDATARKTDAALLRRQADELLTKSNSTDDPMLREGYRVRAKELLVKADA